MKAPTCYLELKKLKSRKVIVLAVWRGDCQLGNPYGSEFVVRQAKLFQNAPLPLFPLFSFSLKSHYLQEASRGYEYVKREVGDRRGWWHVATCPLHTLATLCHPERSFGQGCGKDKGLIKSSCSRPLQVKNVTTMHLKNLVVIRMLWGYELVPLQLQRSSLRQRFSTCGLFDARNNPFTGVA